MDKLIYDGWLKLYKREVKGRAYEIIKNYDGLAVIILNEFNEVLLVKQFRPAIMDYTLEIPAGCLDIEGENLESCMAREIEEETGLLVKEEALELVVTYKPLMGFTTSNLYIFLTKVKKEELKTNIINDLDVSEVKWVSIKEIGDMIAKVQILDGKTIMSYYYLMSKLDCGII
ncbi:MAG TPA: NUDIX hydrolase [Clostridiaceae bacterium]